MKVRKAFILVLVIFVLLICGTGVFLYLNPGVEITQASVENADYSMAFPAISYEPYFGLPIPGHIIRKYAQLENETHQLQKDFLEKYASDGTNITCSIEKKGSKINITYSGIGVTASGESETVKQTYSYN